MSPRWRRGAAALTLVLAAAQAGAVEPQPFSWWVLALSWSPEFCSQHAGDPQCKGDYGFILHGLWPQYLGQEPAQCPRPGRLPTQAIERMRPLMPSEKLVRHEWARHGVCTGWSVDEYFSAVESAWRHVKVPHTYEGLGAPLPTTAAEIQGQFQTFNPGFSDDSIQLVCTGQYLSEVRLCMNRNYSPHRCSDRQTDRCGRKIVIRQQK